MRLLPPLLMAELQPTRESKHSSQWTTCAPCDSVFLRVAMYAFAAPLSSLSESLNQNVWRPHPLEPASLSIPGGHSFVALHGLQSPGCLPTTSLRLCHSYQSQTLSWCRAAEAVDDTAVPELTIPAVANLLQQLLKHSFGRKGTFAVTVLHVDSHLVFVQAGKRCARSCAAPATALATAATAWCGCLPARACISDNRWS